SKTNPPLAKLASPLDRGAAKKRRHFFFFRARFFFAEEDFFLGPNDRGLALTRTNATIAGSLPRTLHEWLVPRCTRMSPALSSVSPFSITAWISPLRTIA